MSAEFFAPHHESHSDEDILDRLQAGRQLVNKINTLWELYLNKQVEDRAAAEESIRALTLELRQEYEALNTILRPVIDNLKFDVSLPLLILQNAADNCEEMLRML